MNRLKLLPMTIGIILTLAISSVFAGREAHRLHARHNTILVKRHICLGAGAGVGIHQLNIHGSILFNDHVGFRLFGYGDWDFEGGGTKLEVVYKPAIRWRFHPFLFAGGGMHVQRLDATFLDNSSTEQHFQEHAFFPTMHIGIGGEVRFGSKDQNGISLEFAGVYGKSDPLYVYTDEGLYLEQKHKIDPYQVESYTAKLLYTYYFCTPIDVEGEKDYDEDGIKNKDDACPEKQEDFDGFNDSDGCPDPDNDGDGVPDATDKCDGEKEDADGFEDRDGCPDPDNDEDGILDEDDKCPSLAEDKDGYSDDDGCPESDNDGDGFPDYADSCPNSAEDPDGYNDEDGCPENDNDGDGVADFFDKCPQTPENMNGYEDQDGCPDERPVAVELEQPKAVEIIRDGLILEGVNFASGRSDIEPSSFPTLDSVVASLEAWPEVRIEVQGHTDKIGSARKNQELSQRRAASVRRYLTSKGINEKRITAVGYGEEDPIADNNTASGRAKNRRVALKRLDSDKE